MKRAAAAMPIFLAFAANAMAQSGQELIAASLQRYALPPHVYEEQALVMTNRQGRQTVRTLRSYTVVDEGGRRNLRVIETPADAKGTTIYIGKGQQATTATSPAFGSDFTLVDLDVEQPRDFRYERDSDQVLGRVAHYVLRAIPADESVVRRTGYHERRLYLRKDNLFVSRIDYRDGEGRQIRRQTFRDPVPDDAGAWRPRMILMEDLRDGERSLIKVERRVHSSDYVPAAVFAGLRTEP